MNPSTISFGSFLIVGLTLISLYNTWLVLNPFIYIVLAVIMGAVYFTNMRVNPENKKANKLMILTLSLMGVGVFSSFIYHNWKLTNLISETTMMRFILISFAFLALYINVIYIRAEQSYKKKRGNQRIKEEPKQGYIEQFKEAFKKKEQKENEIVLKLGISAEREDRRG